MFVWWHRVRDGTLSRTTFRRHMKPLIAEVEELLDDAAVCPCVRTQGKAKALIDDWDALWTFVGIEGVAPTNNEAERDLRHAVILRKLTYGTQSARGSRFVGRSDSSGGRSGHRCAHGAAMRCVRWSPGSHGLCGWRGLSAPSTIFFVTDAAKKILAQIEELPEEEQDLIVDTLVARRRGTDGVSPELRDELLRRVRRIKSGEVGLLDGEEAFRKLRAKYDR